MTETSRPVDPPTSALEPAVTSLAATPEASPPRSGKAMLILGVALLLGLSAVATALFLTTRTLGDVRDENREMAGSLASLKAEVAALRADVAAIPSSVGQLPQPADGTASAAPSNAGAGITGLPRLTDGGADQAIGMVINNVAGIEYYTGEQASYSPGDGVARAWFVWAHWCPYCQEEMPLVSDWVNQQATDHPHMEVVSITTAIDPQAANPLEPYLDSGNYPFPVLVDGDGSLAAQLGVSAFPFWVFTGPDGSVLGRTAGLLSGERLADIFAQLELMGAEAAG